MRFWEKGGKKDLERPSVARVALQGAPREVWIEEALKALTLAGNSDRIGVWMEARPGSSPQDGSSAEFRGRVWDRENGQMPVEWASLSAESVLPEELRTRREVIHQDLEALSGRPIIGPLVELRLVWWIPIGGKGRLWGVILAGSKGRPFVFSRTRAQAVAAELALAAELEHEHSVSRRQAMDLEMARGILSSTATDGSSDTLLSNLVESCTAKPAQRDTLGAEFAAIGAVKEQDAVSAESAVVEFAWRSGDQGWMRAIENQPLSSVWRRALETRSVAGSEAPAGWGQSSVARIVAFPLESGGRLLGTLVTGLPASAASLANLERFKERAALAAVALQQKRRVEEESQRSAWNRSVLESLGEPLLLLDRAGRITLASRGAKELAKPPAKPGAAPPSDFSPAQYFDQLFSGRDTERVHSWLRKAMDQPSAISATKESSQVVLHNGVNVTLRLLAPPQGAHTAVLLEPLAAREPSSAAALAETELRNVIEWLEEGIVLFDHRENVRFMNTRFEQLAGLAPGDSAKINTLEELIVRLESQSADPMHFAARWRELTRETEGGVREEFQMVRPAPHILERASRPVLDPQGGRLGRVEIYRDLTAQRVFQSKLLQTEKQMVSGIAHELSNPLTSILGYAQRLLLRKNASGRSEEARQIYQEAERASTILRQLLLNARETIPEKRQVSLNQVVERALDLQRFRLAAEKIRLELDLDPALPFVRGDAGHLQQVLINLVGNAQQALEQQGQEGIIRLRTRRIGEQRVLLEVEDNGPGIPPAIQARIFDPFFTTKPAGVGTGLGLAIVLSVVREHGGRVQVVSPPQGGAVFQVELPAASQTLPEQSPAIPSFAAKLPPLEEAKPRESAARFADASARGGQARVLIVEDEPTVARLIADVLADEGMQVEVLLDGREALERAAVQSYDLLICDMKMPGLDGQHFYKSLERAGSPVRGRFLFVTGDIVAAQTRDFLDRNGLPHVAKPFRVEELTEKVYQVLESQGRELSAVARRKAAKNG